MNTKKACGARAPLGRCLIPTKFSPGCLGEEKKTLSSATRKATRGNYRKRRGKGNDQRAFVVSTKFALIIIILTYVEETSRIQIVTLNQCSITSNVRPKDTEYNRTEESIVFFHIRNPLGRSKAKFEIFVSFSPRPRGTPECARACAKRN